MKFCLLIMAIFLITIISAAKEPDVEQVPRGVPYNRAALYKRKFEFLCLDGSKSIMYDQINDDYCDCPDGSDEPGTSACPSGIFHCANKGHTAIDIPSSRVNDKICDCCDGSDEYDGAVDCSNICDELGRSAREEKARQMEIAKKGFATRQILAKEGQRIKEEKIGNMVPLKAERDQLLPTKDILITRKKEAEDSERILKDQHNNKWMAAKLEKKKEKASVVFKEIDSNNDQKITHDEMKRLAYVDSNYDGEVSDEEVKVFISVDEADYEYFLSNMYDTLEITKKRYSNKIKSRDVVDESDDMIADDDKAHTDEQEEEEEVLIESNDVMPPYDEDTQKAIADADAVRKEFDELDIKIGSIDNQIREAEAFTEQDFGNDLAWAPLKGQCFELNEMQYIYKLCPFDKTVQKDKNGYGETSLGHWKDWAGSLPYKYSTQKYEDGQQCWNGPKRSTEVIIECGEENELVGASEPAKCEYRFVFRSPAACNDPDNELPVHTEL